MHSPLNHSHGSFVEARFNDPINEEKTVTKMDVRLYALFTTRTQTGNTIYADRRPSRRDTLDGQFREQRPSERDRVYFARNKVRGSGVVIL